MYLTDSPFDALYLLREGLVKCGLVLSVGGAWRVDQRDFGTRVLMNFLRSALEGLETHQCRTTGLKSGPQEEMYAWRCWSRGVQKGRQDLGSKR